MSAEILDEFRELFREYDAASLMEKIRNNDSSGIMQKSAFLMLVEGYKRAKKEKQDDIFTTKEAFRFATRKEAMQPRLRRIVTENPEIIADAAAGIGLAAMEFSRICERVICFEIDALKCLLIEKNMALYGIKNYSVYNLDSTSDDAKEIMNDADVIFVDPQRISGAIVRKIEENVPALEHFIKNFKRKMISYEISPRIDVKDIDYGCEVELYSEKRRHARTTLYFSEDDERIMRAVNDNSEEIEGSYSDYDFSSEKDILNAVKEGKELFDIDETVMKAGLLNNIYDMGVNAIAIAGNAIIGIDGSKEKIPFCIPRKVISKSDKLSGLNGSASKIEDFGRVILRYSVSQDDYWKEAEKVRKSGSGKINVYVYSIAGKFIAAIDY